MTLLGQSESLVRLLLEARADDASRNFDPDEITAKALAYVERHGLSVPTIGREFL